MGLTFLDEEYGYVHIPHPKTQGRICKVDVISQKRDKDCSGVWKDRTLDGIRLIRYAADNTASPQKDLGICISSSKDRATSKRWRFLRSAVPFCCGVCAQDVWWRTSFFKQKVLKLWFRYSPSLSKRKTWIFLWSVSCDKNFGKHHIHHFCFSTSLLLISWSNEIIEENKQYPKSVVGRKFGHFLVKSDDGTFRRLAGGWRHRSLVEVKKRWRSLSRRRCDTGR